MYVLVLEIIFNVHIINKVLIFMYIQDAWLSTHPTKTQFTFIPRNQDQEKTNQEENVRKKRKSLNEPFTVVFK